MRSSLLKVREKVITKTINYIPSLLKVREKEQRRWNRKIVSVRHVIHTQYGVISRRVRARLDRRKSARRPGLQQPLAAHPNVLLPRRLFRRLPAPHPRGGLPQSLRHHRTRGHCSGRRILALVQGQHPRGACGEELLFGDEHSFSVVHVKLAPIRT